MADGKVRIETKLDNEGFEKGVNEISGSLGGLKGSLKSIAGLAAGAFSVKTALDFTKQCIDMGSAVAEVQNVVDTAFGSMAGKMETFADSAITNFGMSELAAKQTGSTYMAMAKGMGVAEDAASDMAIALTGLSGDVASFFNMDQADAAEKLKSVFTGETESLKALGVVMTQTNLEQYALAHGMDTNISSMSQAELVALRYSFIMDTLSLASGDFVKTQDSWANQTRILSMQWQEFMAQIGQALTTVLTPVIVVLNSLVSILIQHADLILTLAVILGSFATAWLLVNGIVTIWNSIGLIATAVTTGFGAAVAFLTSPIGIVIIAIGALIAIVVLLAQHWEEVKTKAEEVGARLAEIWQSCKETWVESWAAMLEDFKGVVNTIIGLVNSLVSGVVAAVNTIINAINSIKFDVPDWIPGVGGKHIGFDLNPINAPQIPHLAQGAVLPPNKPFLAMVGDQSSGTNVEAPLDTIKQAVAEVMGSGTNNINIEFTGNLAQLGRVLRPVIAAESHRIGRSLITTGGI